MYSGMTKVRVTRRAIRRVITDLRRVNPQISQESLARFMYTIRAEKLNGGSIELMRKSFNRGAANA